MRKALEDGNLYMEIVKHREKFYHPSYVDYSKELPRVIDFLPPATMVETFREDYNEMMGSFIYEKDPLSFDELLISVAAIRSSLENAPRQNDCKCRKDVEQTTSYL